MYLFSYSWVAKSFWYSMGSNCFALMGRGASSVYLIKQATPNRPWCHLIFAVVVYHGPVLLIRKAFHGLRENAWNCELHELFWKKSRNVLRTPILEDYWDLIWDLITLTDSTQLTGLGGRYLLVYYRNEGTTTARDGDHSAIENRSLTQTTRL